MHSHKEKENIFFQLYTAGRPARRWLKLDCARFILNAGDYSVGQIAFIGGNETSRPSVVHSQQTPLDSQLDEIKRALDIDDPARAPWTEISQSR